MSSIVSLLAVLLPCIGASTAQGSNPAIPLYYAYGGYPKVMTNIHFGNPIQNPGVPTVVDLGSANYWVYGPNATVNYGSPFLGVQGPCNITAHPNYNYHASKTATKRVPKTRGYSYGGNGKLVSSYFSVNDTINFANDKAFPALSNIQVAISNYTLIKIQANSCNDSKNFDYDHSILGLSRFDNPTYPTVGPSFRQNLLTSGAINSSVMSIWFNKAPSKVNGTFRGTALFGSIAKGKYSGPLVGVKPSPPKDTYVGYYIPPAQIEATNVKNSSEVITIKNGKGTINCLVDSGTGNDILPVSMKDLLKATGLIEYNGYPAYDGPCESIPKSAVLKFTFPGLQKNVTIEMPLRNYARGNSDYLGDSKKCALSIEAGASYGCVLGAPFSTTLFFAVDDSKNEIFIAQGGVS